MNYHASEVFSEKPEDVTYESLPYEFWQLIREVSDWGIVQNLLKGMPEDYMQRYLNEYFPEISTVQRASELKIIAKRPEWVGTPTVWLQEVFG